MRLRGRGPGICDYGMALGSSLSAAVVPDALSAPDLVLPRSLQVALELMMSRQVAWRKGFVGDGDVAGAHRARMRLAEDVPLPDDVGEHGVGSAIWGARRMDFSRAHASVTSSASSASAAATWASEGGETSTNLS